jgi:hypothetical protein
VETGDLPRAPTFQNYCIDDVALETDGGNPPGGCPLCPETAVHYVVKPDTTLGSVLLLPSWSRVAARSGSSYNTSLDTNQLEFGRRRIRPRPCVLSLPTCPSKRVRPTGSRGSSPRSPTATQSDGAQPVGGNGAGDACHHVAGGRFLASCRTRRIDKVARPSNEAVLEARRPGRAEERDAEGLHGPEGSARLFAGGSHLAPAGSGFGNTQSR